MNLQAVALGLVGAGKSQTLKLMTLNPPAYTLNPNPDPKSRSLNGGSYKVPLVA